jgi:hypothetical protein
MSAFDTKRQELKTPVRIASYNQGLEDCKEQVLIELKKLRRRTSNWKGVNMAINTVYKLVK